MLTIYLLQFVIGLTWLVGLYFLAKYLPDTDPESGDED